MSPNTSDARPEHPGCLVAVDCAGKYFVDFSRRELDALLAGGRATGGPRVTRGKLGDVDVVLTTVTSHDGPNQAQLDRLPPEASLPENLAFAGQERFREDYAGCLDVLRRWRLDSNAPSVEHALAIIRRLGDQRLSAMRTECQDVRLVVAALMTGADYQRLHDARQIDRRDSTLDFFNGAIVRPQLPPNCRPFSVGLVEAATDLQGLAASERNPRANGGLYYDHCRDDLDLLGLRLPRGHEYVVLSEMLRGKGITLDKGSSILDRGEREAIASPFPIGHVMRDPQVPGLMMESGDMASYNLVRRPSAWATFI